MSWIPATGDIGVCMSGQSVTYYTCIHVRNRQAVVELALNLLITRLAYLSTSTKILKFMECEYSCRFGARRQLFKVLYQILFNFLDSVSLLEIKEINGIE